MDQGAGRLKLAHELAEELAHIDCNGCHGIRRTMGRPAAGCAIANYAPWQGSLEPI